MSKSAEPIVWCRADGSTVSCTESVKVLTQDWEEARETLQAFFDDAVLMGVGKAEWKKALHALVESLECDYKEKTAPVESRGRA